MSHVRWASPRLSSTSHTRSPSFPSTTGRPGRRGDSSRTVFFSRPLKSKCDRAGPDGLLADLVGILSASSGQTCGN